MFSWRGGFQTALHLQFEGMVVCGVEVSVFVMPHEVSSHLVKELVTLLKPKGRRVTFQRNVAAEAQGKMKRVEIVAIRGGGGGWRGCRCDHQSGRACTINCHLLSKKNTSTLFEQKEYIKRF